MYNGGMSAPRRILAILPGFIPSTFLNVVKPFLALQETGLVDFRVNLEAYLRPGELNWPDLVVFCRNTEPIFASILEMVRQKRLPYVYDLDDNLFEIPLDTDLGKYHRAPQRLEQLRNYIQHASLVRVYSLPLAKRALELNSAVFQVEAAIDWQTIQPRPLLTGRPLQIVYATSRAEDQLAAIFLPAVEQILERFPGQVEMNFWGFLPAQFAGRPGVRHLRPVQNYNEFMQRFSGMGFDIGLAPLLDDEFHRSKTNNKYREYAACEIAGVYSNVDTYSRYITDGETGLLVDNSPAAWNEALTRLITDAELRQKIARQALNYARQHFSQDAYLHTWQTQVDLVLSQGEGKAPAADSQIEAADSPPQPISTGSWYLQTIGRLAGRVSSQTPTGLWRKLTLTFSNLRFLHQINRRKRL
jgi:glycosyltransferase involved in cell wall biosynthesis